MPLNFPDVWVKRVRTNILTAVALVATWLDGIPEIDAEVTELGAGDASETNIIYIPITTFEPDVLINNTTYPIPVQPFDDDNVILKLDKFQTKQTSISDDQIIGAAYDRIDAATRTHVNAINKKKFAKAIHAFAPASNSALTPVITTTGPAAPGGRLRMIYEDLVALKDKMDKAGTPAEGRRFVPCTDHYNDMLLDRKAFGDQIVNMKAGTLAPIIAGFEIYPAYINNPNYTTAGVKLPFASVPGATDKQASVAFVVGNIGKKTGLTKQYFAKASEDPASQTNRVNYRHYFIAMPLQNQQIGALLSGS